MKKNVKKFLFLQLHTMLLGIIIGVCIGVYSQNNSNSITKPTTEIAETKEDEETCIFESGDKIVFVTGGRDDYGGIVDYVEDGNVYIKWKVKLSYFLKSYDNTYSIKHIWKYLDLPEYMDSSNERLRLVDDETW